MARNWVKFWEAIDLLKEELLREYGHSVTDYGDFIEFIKARIGYYMKLREDLNNLELDNKQWNNLMKQLKKRGLKVE